MQQTKTNPWLIAFRVFFTAALVLCIAFIFRNSLEAAAASTARSREAMDLVNRALGKVHLGPLSEHIIRKLAHFAEFTLLGFLLMMCLRVYTQRFVRHTAWPLLGGMTVALSDETIQLRIPGRTSQVTDVWIDMAGVLAGAFAALLLLLLVRLLLYAWRTRRENARLRAENEAYHRREQAEEHRRLAHRAVERARRAAQAQTAPPGGMPEEEGGFLPPDDDFEEADGEQT